MDWAALLQMIMMIIQMIMQLINGGKVPTGSFEYTSQTNYSNFSCSPAKWVENSGSTAYLSGTVVKDCEIYPYTNSQSPDFNGVTAFINEGILHDSNNIVYLNLSSGADGSQLYDLSGNVNFDTDQELVSVDHQSSVQSLDARYVRSDFKALSFGDSTAGKYVRDLNSSMALTSGQRGGLKFHLSTNARVSRPFGVTNKNFKSSWQKAVESRVDETAVRVLNRLTRHL